MSVIKLERLATGSNVYDLATYPGSGAYLTGNGIAIVCDSCITVINYTGWQSLVSEDAGSTGIDVHRLFDQMITLTKKSP